jgi:hypothetical protein
MPEPALSPPTPKPALPAFPGSQVPFGVNEMRLSWRHWAAVVLILVVAVIAIPRVWARLERFETGPDYRIPYELSKDYWLFQRRLNQVNERTKIFVLGDSVVWGEYVRPNGTLSHFLNAEAGPSEKFVNAGVNGLFPLALEGLVRSYGGALRDRKVILQCNVLWMSSPKADLQVQKEEKFNHSRLVPQFWPRIPCYRADANERLGAVVERNVNFISWVSHLQDCYFEQKSILNWTLEDDGNDPPHRPNVYKNPLAQIRMEVPRPPADDPQRGPSSPRHQPWTAHGSEPTRFDWVTIESSLQWGAFQRLVSNLRARGDDVLVLVGPFNEHMIAEESKPGYRALREGVTHWLGQNDVAFLVPEILPSNLYADASHPLTDGYELLAKRLQSEALFQSWVRK